MTRRPSEVGEMEFYCTTLPSK